MPDGPSQPGDIPFDELPGMELDAEPSSDTPTPRASRDTTTPRQNSRDAKSPQRTWREDISKTRYWTVPAAAMVMGVAAYFIFVDQGPSVTGHIYEPTVQQEVPVRQLENQQPTEQPDSAVDDASDDPTVGAAPPAPVVRGDGSQLNTLQQEPDTKGAAGSGGGSGQVDAAEKAAAVGAGTTKWSNVEKGSYIFTIIVGGDGETVSKADNTSYQVSFIVNNEWPVNEFFDETGFSVLVGWNSLAQQYGGSAWDSQYQPMDRNSYDIEIEWLDASTLQVTADIVGLDIDVAEMRTEIALYVTDDDGAFLYDNRNVAIWVANP